MQLAKILVLTIALSGALKASIAVETALPLPTALPLEAAISGASDSPSGSALHPFAMACGLLAFAAAAQQAFFHGKPVLQRVKVAKD